MHPMAVYCALKGMVPARLNNRARTRLGEDESLRILRELYPSAPTLTYRDNRWAFTRSSSPTWYDEISWDQFPDSVLDELPQKLVDEVLTFLNP